MCMVAQLVAKPLIFRVWVLTESNLLISTRNYQRNDKSGEENVELHKKDNLKLFEESELNRL